MMIFETKLIGRGVRIYDKNLLLGDPQQIEKLFLDERTNGLSYAAKHMMGTLTEKFGKLSQRSNKTRGAAVKKADA